MFNDNFEERLTQYQPDLVKMAYNILGNNCELSVDDLVQGTSILAIKKKNKFTDRGGKSFGNWLYTLMRRSVFLNYMTKVNRRRNKLIDDPYIAKSVVNDTTMDFVFDDNTNTVINSLPIMLQPVFTYHIKGYKNKEISAALGINESNVKNSLRKAKEFLKATFTKNDIIDLYN